MKIVRLTQARIVNSIVFVFLSATILSFITTTFAKDKKPTPARPSTQVGEVKGKGNFGIVCNPYNEDWEDPEKTINLLKELGVKLVVSRILWNDIEEKKGKFSEESWKVYDELVNKFTSCGIDVTTIVVGTPRWAIDPTLNPENWKGRKFAPPPKNPKDLADFVSVAVKRYKNKVKTWAFFNAPQNKKHWTEPTHLADLYRAGYEAVKKERPDSTVVMSGLKGNMQIRETYLEAFHKAGGEKYVDMYDFHVLLSAFPFITNIESCTIAFKEFLKKFGEDKKPIQYGAIGWPSLFNPPAGWQKNKISKDGRPLAYAPLNPEDQANRLVITMVLGRSLGVERIFWTRTRDKAPQSGPEHQKYMERIKENKPKWKVASESTRTMGIIDYAYQQKPSYRAFKTLIEKIDGANFVRGLDIGNSGKMCIFKKGGMFTGVFWLWEGKKTIELSSNTKTIKVFDIYGKNAKTIPVVEGKFTLNVTNTPIYLEGDIEDIKITSLRM